MARNAGSSYPSYLTYPAYLSYLLVLTCAARISAHDPITTKVTWSREVVRIVNKSCTGCHVAGGVAPMPLSTYDEARPWAKAIKDEVVARRMPKWPAARGFGHFSNDPSLSPFEIELIAAWADGGAPKGEERDLPARVVEPAMRKPDLVLPLPMRTGSPAGDRRSVTFPSTFRSDRWITGWEFVPNDGAITAAEFRFVPGDPIGTWTPPERLVSVPDGAGQFLAVGASIEVTVTYRSGRQQQDFPIGIPSKAPQLGFMLRETAPPLGIRNISIPCGSTTVNLARGTIFAIRVSSAIAGTPVGVTLVPMLARLSPREGAGPDPASLFGAPSPVTWIRNFDPTYQPTYRLALSMPGDWNAVTPSSPDVKHPCLVTLGVTVPRPKASVAISLSQQKAR